MVTLGCLNEGQLRRVLSESMSSVVYHFSSLPKMANIASRDCISLSPALSGISNNIDGKRLFYLSTARSRLSGAYGERAVKKGYAVCITLDGEKLNNRFKARPVAYWSSRDRNGRMVQRENGEYSNSDDELEDRLLSDKSRIEKLSEYVLRIDILMDPENEQDCLYAAKIIQAYGSLVAVYGDAKDYVRQSENTINDKILDMHGQRAKNTSALPDMGRKYVLNKICKALVAFFCSQFPAVEIIKSPERYNRTVAEVLRKYGLEGLVGQVIKLTQTYNWCNDMNRFPPPNQLLRILDYDLNTRGSGNNHYPELDTLYQIVSDFFVKNGLSGWNDFLNYYKQFQK